MQSLRPSRKARTSALLLLGATAFGLGLAPHVDAQATTGGGSLVKPVTGPLATQPVNALTNPITGMPGPSFGLGNTDGHGGTNMVLVKNWDFGSLGNIKNYDDMSREFFYHDQFDNLADGQYGASAAAPDFQDSVSFNDVASKQQIEGGNSYWSYLSDYYRLPSVRSFTQNSLLTYLVPTEGPNGDSSGNVSPYSRDQVASGAFMAKWRLPNGGKLLGQDIVWETKVRYQAPPDYWFALWASGTAAARGAEADIVESWPVLDDYPNPHTGKYWHSNMVPKMPNENGDTDNVLDLYQYDHFDLTMQSLSPPIYNYNAASYHIWTWVYHKDDTYSMYVDGGLVQANTQGHPYPWTVNALAPLPTPIDATTQQLSSKSPSAAPCDMEFKFDPTWANTTIDYEHDPVPASTLAGTNYEFSYSRVYLSGGTVAEGAFPGNASASGSPLAISIPNTIPASDYDTGGDGSGYHLYAGGTPISSPYRTDNNGNIVAGSSPGGNGYILTNNAPHDWYKYTVNVPPTANDTASVFTASFKVQSSGTGGAFHLEDENGNDLTGSIVVPSNVPGWQTVNSKASFPFSLSTGPNPGDGYHTLRLVMDTIGTNGSVVNFGSMTLAYATALGNANFLTPALAGSPSPFHDPSARVYDVPSSFLYNPTGNGYPLGAWTFNGNAGLQTYPGSLFGPPAFPAGVTEIAFVQAPIAPQSGGGIYPSATGGRTGSMSQTFNLQPGTYTFSCQASQVYTNYQQQTALVELDGGSLAGGKDLGTIAPPYVGFGAITLPAFTVTTAGLHTITLAATNNNSGLLAYIANIQLNYMGAAAATFVKSDTTTQGTWKGAYGTDGYSIAGDTFAPPVYGTLGLSSNTGSYSWASSTTSGNALQKSGSATDRIAAEWGPVSAPTTSFDLNCNLTDGNTHQVALYALDYDTNNNRTETVQVIDAASNTTLDTETLSSFTNGTYLVWNVKGNVIFRVTQTGGNNATLSGIFLDPVGGTASAGPTVTNGSFEKPVVPYAGATYYTTGDAPLATSGWNFTGFSGIITNGGKLGNATSPDGVQAAFVTQGGTVSQSIPFATGGYYTLTLQAEEAYWDALQTDGTTHAVQVLVDGTSAGTYNPYRGGYSQGTFSLGFLASGSHTIQMQGTSSDGSGFTDFIDQVAVAPTPVPVVQNASFEKPVVPYAGATYYTTGDAPLATSGWNFTGFSGIITNGGKLGNATSPDGVQAAFVTQGGTVSQSIPFATGGYYTLTLQAEEAYWDALQTDGTTHAVQVLVDGTSAGTYNPYRGGYSQGTFSLGFLASGSHTIQMQGTSSDGSGFTDFIDQVAVAPAAGPMAGAVFSGPVAAQAAHLPSFGHITPFTASAYRAMAATAPANPPSAAFDTKVSTFFDYAQSSGGYVGIALKAARSVSKINYAPRVGYEKRMVGGVFEGSNTSATAGYTALATVTATPKDGTGNTLPVTNHTAYKWLRYRGPSGGYCDVAEIQLLH